MRQRLITAVGVLAFFAAPLYAQTAQTVAPRLLPGTKTGVLSTIAGKALNAVNVPMGSMPIRLRDVRFGRVVATTTTDKAGQFDFKAVDTGSFVVEMTSSSGDAVLASSSIIYVGSGEILSTILKMPFSGASLGKLMGESLPYALTAAGAATAITSAAGSANTPAQKPAGEPATSQNPTMR